MHRLFGRAQEEPTKAPAPSLQDASAKIDSQIQTLEEKIIAAEKEAREQVAKGAANPMAKQRALQAMKKKKMYEQQRDQLLGTQFNVENLAFQQEQAEVTMTVVEAMKAGQEQLKAATGKIDASTVDKLTDDMADLNDEMKEIQSALAASSMGVDGADDAELEDEFAKMEEEMAMMALAGGGASSAAPAAASAAPAAPAEAEPSPMAMASAPPA